MRIDTGDADSDGPAGGGAALFRLVRYWSRRWTLQAAQGTTGDFGQVGHILLLEALDAAEHGGIAAIGDVAAELGLDRSNASRMLAEAVTAGLVDKRASLDDARRAELTITEAGERLLKAARVWQERVFAELVADWPKGDARRFAGYLKRLAEQQASVSTVGAPQ